MRHRAYHLAAAVDSEIALCGAKSGDCILVDDMRRHPDVVCCVGCLKNAVAVDMELEKIEVRYSRTSR